MWGFVANVFRSWSVSLQLTVCGVSDLTCRCMRDGASSVSHFTAPETVQELLLQLPHPRLLQELSPAGHTHPSIIAWSSMHPMQAYSTILMLLEHINFTIGLYHYVIIPCLHLHPEPARNSRRSKDFTIFRGLHSTISYSIGCAAKLGSRKYFSRPFVSPQRERGAALLHAEVQGCRY